jgi:hypothetical protein
VQNQSFPGGSLTTCSGFGGEDLARGEVQPTYVLRCLARCIGGRLHLVLVVGGNAADEKKPDPDVEGINVGRERLCLTGQLPCVRV